MTICNSIVMLAAIAAVAPSSNARAEGRLYLDAGGGLASIREGQEFLGTSGSSLRTGATFHLAVLANLTRPTADALPQLGLMHRIASGADDAANYALQATYPMFRFESRNVFVGIGATPFVWKRRGAALGFDDFERAAGAYGVLADAGFHYPITPEISFGATAGAQVIYSGSGLGPRPTLEFSAIMRLYFERGGKADAFDAERDGMGPYKGWRYPYGRELR